MIMAEQVTKKIAFLIRELKQIPEIDESMNLIESGLLDSFDIMTLIAAVGEEFGVEVGGDDLTPENFETVAAIAALVKRLKGEKC